MLYLTNTVTATKEKCNVAGKSVTLYVCGITPYSPAHIGHGRCYVSFDMLYRLLTFLGYNVTYCRNFTDIDDKLLVKAEQEYQDPMRYLEVAAKNIVLFHADMKALNCISPTYEPRVTDHIPEIIHFIQELIDAGHAYVVNSDVYFDIATFSAYGKLSKQNISELKSGTRGDVRSEKKNPLDFALWKSENPGMFWHSPWGWGRPGWHIECSALARRYLGDQIDIHAGGLDLIFPHHENEIAQSESLFNAEFARFWLHNGLVTIGNEKMSKSLGNSFLLHDIFKQCDPMVLRYYFLTHHYRSPLEFSWDLIAAAQKSYQKLVTLFGSCDPVDLVYEDCQKYPILHQMVTALCDDLNSPAMFGILFGNSTEIEKHQGQKSAIVSFLKNVLGLTLQPLAKKEVEITPEIALLLEQREKARQEKDWKTADALRDRLQALGVELHDKKQL